METKTANTLLTVSEKAAARILEIRKEEGHDPNCGIRVAVQGGGCSGLTYKLDFDSLERPGDHVIEDKGIKVFVEAKSLLYLVGTELDFSDGLNGKGFQFLNPNASRTCACGESFAV
jgi:iron-sulfur cluster assembly protein